MWDAKKDKFSRKESSDQKGRYTKGNKILKLHCENRLLYTGMHPVVVICGPPRKDKPGCSIE